MPFFGWQKSCVVLVAVAVVCCTNVRLVAADNGLAESQLILQGPEDKIRRLRIAGWVFVGMGAATPVIVWSTVTKQGRGDDDSVVGIARGTSFLMGALFAGAVGGSMLGRARRLDKKSSQANRVDIGVGLGTVTFSGDF